MCVCVCVLLVHVICRPSQFELLPPAMKLGQGYVFTGVCDSVHRGGMPGYSRGVCVVALGQGACVVA